MTGTRTLPQTASLDETGLRRVLAVLCLTEITSWGILYYAFPVLSVSISADTGWSLPVLTAAFSLSQLAAALTGIPVGRIIDRIGPRVVMTAGSVLAVPSLLVVAAAPNLPVFYAGWLAAGVAMGAVLYPPAFAALTRWYGDKYVKALMILTLAAGLASTVFAPLTAALVNRYDWRATYLVLAAILAIITVPGHLLGLRGRWPHPPAPAGDHPVDHRDASRSLAFAALVAALSLGAFTAFAGVFNLVPLLIEQGFSPALAALTLGLGGAGQVLGRLGYLPIAARTTARTRIVVILAATAASTALLGIVTSVVALIAVAIGAGLVRGIFTLIQATAITDRWGATHYGRLNGLMSAPVVIVMALAPWAGTALSAWTGSYAHAYLILAALAVVAALIGAASIPHHSKAANPS
ncbi:MFS transporter [Rhodococcus koreensis]|uniref:Predicted arabinose efflux permease, MFS family n=1 Tax=Rhodococcus koreensis TaxID=99653 RepID=A0A1H4VZD3_9NOCA|nr:MFS transporter [Rhodococcus koreensis]SEC86315.1 Predicted arabinose efflux permease, MFS family [Rhodococcus koreensis]